ncbi:hypothetical protein BBI10_19155 [Pseudomonas graminis]|uniref:Uncharacterized protein n=1 Tax=Pseudomonas graminis TaxID=158627 RepID=A0A1C2DM45_9PSED|nr:hypothetical protein BBI10_19155 [Pseudomonas graminis]
MPAEAGSDQAEVFRFHRFNVGEVPCIGIRYAVRDSLHLVLLGLEVAAQCLLKVILPITPSGADQLVKCLYCFFIGLK